MIRIFKNLLTSLIDWVKPTKKVLDKEISCTCIDNEVEVEITWDDINDGVPESSTECSLARALRREGIRATVTDYSIILEDGFEYHPENFSDHWKAYNNSKKLKPMVIAYKR